MKLSQQGHINSDNGQPWVMIMKGAIPLFCQSHKLSPAAFCASITSTISINIFQTFLHTLNCPLWGQKEKYDGCLIIKAQLFDAAFKTKYTRDI